MIPLHAIHRSCALDLASLTHVAMIDPAELDEQPDWYLLNDVSELVFKPGKAPFNLQPIISTARLEDESDPGDIAGDYFTHKLTLQVKGVRGEVDMLRAKLRNRRVHFLVTYQDGRMRFIPSMRVNSKADSGARIGADRNGYQITCTCKLDRPAPWVGGTYNIIGGPGSDPGGGTNPITVDTITTSSSTYTHTLPAGALLMAIYISGNAAQEVSIGLTSGGQELGGPIPLESSAPGNRATFETMYRTPASTDIHFSGLAGTNAIEIWYFES
jgi:hypothetical protein